MNEGYRRCCGMDIHKDTVVVCVLPPAGAEGQTVRKVYSTFRNDLIRMRVWLKQLKVTEIAMESTGVYWRPVWNVLDEAGFRLLLVNPVQVKALAGRKSDGRDARRIAEYLQDGRLDGSFVPSAEVRQLRMMLRHRISLLEQRNEVHNQIRDLFETANFKLFGDHRFDGSYRPRHCGGLDSRRGFTGTIELEGAGESSQEGEPRQGIAERIFQRFSSFHAGVPLQALSVPHKRGGCVRRANR
jgi:transposase